MSGVEVTTWEAADALGLAEDRVTALIAVAAVPVIGRRRTGRRGPRPRLFSLAALGLVLAEEAARTAKAFTDNDWIAAALLGRGRVRADPAAGEIHWADGGRAETLNSCCYGEVRAGRMEVGAHRLIWIAAEGEIPPRIQVNHINRRRWDNRRANLELVAAGEDVRHWQGLGYETVGSATAELAALPPAEPPPPHRYERVGGVFRKGPVDISAATGAILARG